MNATMAANPIGLVIGLLSASCGDHPRRRERDRDEHRCDTDYTSALEQDGNAIGAHTAKMAAKSLQDAKVVSTAKQYGLTLTDLTKSVTGNADAQDRVNGVIDTQIKKSTTSRPAAAAMGSNGQSAAPTIAGEHADKLRALKSELDKQSDALARNVKDQRESNDASQGATDAIKSNASAYGMSTSAYQTASEAAEKQAASTRESTREMQLARTQRAC